MPVEGFPDPTRHRLCLRCRKWYGPEEGATVQPEPASVAEPTLGMFTALRSLCGVPPKPHFMCRRCLKVRRCVSAAIFATFGVLVALVLVLERLGLI